MLLSRVKIHCEVVDDHDYAAYLDESLPEELFARLPERLEAVKDKGQNEVEQHQYGEGGENGDVIVSEAAILCAVFRLPAHDFFTIVDHQERDQDHSIASQNPSKGLKDCDTGLLP